MRLPIFLWLFVIALASCDTTPKPTVVKINHPYKFPQEIANTLKRDTTPWKFEPAAWAYSRIGDFDNALIQWDSSREMLAKNFGFLLNTDSVDINKFNQKYQARSAKEIILEQAQQHRILLINEGHHLPNHRNFTRSLLEDLWKLGYRHIGFEAIVDDLETMHQNGYPTYGLGTYTEEPQFGELIRTALSIGFQVFGYDSDDLYDEEREIDQAKGIQEVLEKNLNDKVIVHCGFGHLYENPISRLMGYHLKELTNLDPLTVNQYDYSERHSTPYEHPIFTNLVKQESVVYVDEKGGNFHRLTRDSLNEDILVFHPRTVYKNGRPSWLEDETRKITKIDLPEIPHNCPCLVMAIPVDEPLETAVPVDVVAIGQDMDFVHLALRKGEYQIVIQNEQKEGIRFLFERR